MSLRLNDPTFWFYNVSQPTCLETHRPLLYWSVKSHGLATDFSRTQSTPYALMCDSDFISTDVNRQAFLYTQWIFTYL